jgi:hypothetical protein
MFNTVDGGYSNRSTVGIGLLLLAAGLLLNYIFERPGFFGIRDDVIYPALFFF